MLRITEQQLQAFAPQMRRLFEERCVAMLRAAYPAVTQPHPHEKLLELVRVAATRAAGYGIEADADVERWLHLMMRLGPRFDEDPRHPELRATLDDRGVVAQVRLDTVERLAGAAARTGAAAP
jgi:hypothetical protein